MYMYYIIDYIVLWSSVLYCIVVGWFFLILFLLVFGLFLVGVIVLKIISV